MKLTLAILLFAALVLLIFGVPLAASLSLDSSGHAAVGLVTGKVERIREYYMRAARELEVTVQSRPAEAQKDESSNMILDEDAYDRITVGAHLSSACPIRAVFTLLLQSINNFAM